MIKKILLLLAAGLAIFLVYVAALPASYSVSRSTTIAATPEAIFEHVNNLHKWDDWSPWAKRDPNAKMTFEGPESGKGALFKWDGNSDVGKGQMKIQKSVPPKMIEIRLDFEDPFPGTSYASFQFEPKGVNATQVTWTLAGDQDYFERLICTLLGMNMDKMIGKDYETGLANLKRVVEGGQV